MEAQQSQNVKFEAIEIPVFPETEHDLKRKWKQTSTSTPDEGKIRPRASSPVPVRLRGIRHAHDCVNNPKNIPRSRRTSTPVPTSPEDEDEEVDPDSPNYNHSYEKFKYRLEKPLKKRCHRGLEVKDASIISSHLLADKICKLPPRPELDYTCIMTFPGPFNLQEYEAQENLACTSGNWEDCYFHHAEPIVYYVPYVPQVPHYFTQPVYYHYVQYHPYYYPMHV